MIELATTARSAEDAARSLDCELGSIVKSLVFSVGPRPVLAPVAGDRRCRQNTLGRLLGMKGTIDRADADTVRGVTGFSIGGVPPVAHCSHLPTVIDASLWALFPRLRRRWPPSLGLPGDAGRPRPA